MDSEISVNEEFLIKQAKSDPTHFRELYDLYFEEIFRFVIRRVRELEISKDITGEALAYYEGKNWWTRLGVGGYATADGVVGASISSVLLPHEIGHYFGLLHTWEGMDCKNDECLVDGDMVCDTPLDKSVSEPCGGNSCDTDVSSNFSNGNFFMDVAYMSTNFMDYSPCKVDFTSGQA